MTKLRKFIREYHSLIISICLIAVLVSGIVVGIIPTVQKVLSIRSKEMTEARNRDMLRAKMNILNDIDEDTYRMYLNDLVIAIPADKSLPSLFSTIDGLSALTGVSVSNFILQKPGSLASESAKRISKEEKELGSSLLPFSLTVTGTYEQIYAFLKEAIRVRRFFRVRNFEISFVTSENISVRMGMDAFFAPYPTNLGSVSQIIEPLSPTDQSVISQVSQLSRVGQSASNEEFLAPSVEDQRVRTDPFAP